jgi:3-oxoacyl-[acyl-carrier-protein] synthase II
MLETEEHALKRNAKIYCELAGYAANCDAHHITGKDPLGVESVPLLSPLRRDV